MSFIAISMSPTREHPQQKAPRLFGRSLPVDRGSQITIGLPAAKIFWENLRFGAIRIS